jgi:hypothetical protein
MNTTTTIATITPPAATTTAPVVKITRTTLVKALFAEARSLILDDVPTARMVGLPVVTPAGLDRVQAELASREPRGLAWAVIVWMRGNDLERLPASTRRRKVLTGLANWLPGVPRWVTRCEPWFEAKSIHAFSKDAGSTPAEAAGVYGLRLIRLCPPPA